jgi:hypothetical protein
MMRARTKLKYLSEDSDRQRLERKLERLRVALSKKAPKRGASVVGVDEAASLVSKLVKNKDQANKLIEELRRLCE